MNDLDKLMSKLKKPEAKAPTEAKVEKVPEVVPEVIPEAPEILNAPKVIQEVEAMDDGEDDDTDDEDETSPSETEGLDEEVHETQSGQHPIGEEVALLQNNGVFRRELIVTKKEQVDVLKVIAQTLLDIKKKLTGEESGTN